eukprot:78593-Alexandrium_andersonii.AAC.1
MVSNRAATDPLIGSRIAASGVELRPDTSTTSRASIGSLRLRKGAEVRISSRSGRALRTSRADKNSVARPSDRQKR